MSTDAAVAGLRILPTQHGVAEVLNRVQTLARARGLTIFAQIDFSGDAERAGLALRPTGLVILGNPKGGTPLMAATPTVAIDLPLKVLAGRTRRVRSGWRITNPSTCGRATGFLPIWWKISPHSVPWPQRRLHRIRERGFHADFK
jgi:uncharacterized protein (DUF302 family)